MQAHQSHPDIIDRLRRAGGHLRSIIGMIEEGRPCGDQAQQLHAVESAIANAKCELVQDHIEHCLGAGTGGMTAKDALSEFRQLARYL